MRVLVSNDDGVDAPGIRALAKGLREAGHEVLVVAPDRDRSGASNSLTLDAPIRVVQVDETTWKVFGTPTDCVHVAITGMFDVEPDIVVLGGGLSNIDELYTRGVEAVRAQVFSDQLTTPIVRNQLGDSAGVIGAALIGN